MIIMIFEAACLSENLQGSYFLMFLSPLMRESLHAWRDFFPLIREILHAWRESRRNSVQAGDSLSMREGWKPCLWLIRQSGAWPASQSRAGKSSTFPIFPQISIDYSYFSSYFPNFRPHFSRVAHPGRPCMATPLSIMDPCCILVPHALPWRSTYASQTL